MLRCRVVGYKSVRTCAGGMANVIAYSNHSKVAHALDEASITSPEGHAHHTKRLKLVQLYSVYIGSKSTPTRDGPTVAASSFLVHLEIASMSASLLVRSS
jgi:hypothetical protein